MNSARTGTFRSALLVAIASWVVNSHAWAQTTPNPVMPPATPQPAAEGGGAAIAAVVVVVGLFMVIRPSSPTRSCVSHHSPESALSPQRRIHRCIVARVGRPPEREPYPAP